MFANRRTLIALFSMVLALGLVSSMYGSSLPSPIVDLGFNEGSGTTTANSGTAGGELTLSAPMPMWSSNVPPGGGDGSLDFGTEAGGYYVDSLTEISELGGLEKFTVTLWVNCTDSTEGAGGNRLVVWNAGSGGDGLDFVYLSNGSLHMSVNEWPDWPNNRPTQSSEGMIPTDAVAGADNWRFIALTYDSTLASDHVTYYFGSATVPAAKDVSCTYPEGGAVGTSIQPLAIGNFAGNQRNMTGRQFRGLIDEVKIFGDALTLEQIQNVQRGAKGGLASSPNPATDATDVSRDVGELSWKSGEFANTHNVFWGTNFDDVNDATIAEPLGTMVYADLASDANRVSLGRLAYGTTYYWRVDEVNAPSKAGTVFKGEVWNFTVEPEFYPIQGIVATASIPTAATSGGPEVTVNGLGLADGMHDITEGTMWSGPATEGEAVWIQYDFGRVCKVYGMHIWNYNGLYELYLGFGFKAVTIEYAVEPNEWIALGDYELTQASGLSTYAGEAIAVDGIAARAFRITAHSSQFGGTQYGLSEVKFFEKPVLAREPAPTDGATGVSHDVMLNWRPGREAASHEVYFDTNSSAITEGTVAPETVATAVYDPGSLDLGTTYYWMIGEVNDAETPSVLNSEVWSFTVAEYVVIDDFESYTDDPDNQIFSTWFDGYNITTNGSQVGYDAPPYMETAKARRGQAMPLQYDNTSASYSEVELPFDSPQDWTANGADTLSLWFRGDPIPFVETGDGTILMSGVGSDIYGSTDEFRYAYKQLTGNGSITARVDSIDNTNEWAKVGVMIRSSLEVGAMQAHMIATPSNRVEWMPRLTVGADAAGTATDVDSTPLPVWVKVTRTGDSFKGEYSADGQTWTTIATTTAATIEMPDTVYVGLVVCSHVVGTACAAEFSSVSTTGTVTGAWQLADLGVDQPAGNGFDRFYLAVRDSSGKQATFTNPSAAAVAAGTYRQWLIPLSDMTAAGVNPSRVTNLYLGVGDPAGAPQNVSGILYIDDIAFGNPIE